MEYTIMQLMETANYNHEAKKEGWIYEWLNKFISSNQHIMTEEIIKETITNLPPIGIYDNPTNKMKEQKQNLESTLNNKIQINMGRSM